MNRDALLEHAERIEGNAWMIRRVLHDSEVGIAEAALEIVGRIGIIEGHIAGMRNELRGPARPENVHLIGDRPNGDAA